MYLHLFLTFFTWHIVCGTTTYTNLHFEKTPKFECGLLHGGPTVQLINRATIFMDGLYWDYSSQALIFVDRYDSNINWYDIQTGVTGTIHINETEGQELSVIVPVEGADHKYVLAADQYLYLITINETVGVSYTIKRIMTVINDSTKMDVFNKGTVSPNHNLWLGTENRTYTSSSTKQYALLKANVGANVTVMDPNYRTSSGIGWNQESTKLYVVDAATRNLFEYAYDIETSTISNRTLVFNLTDYSSVIWGTLSGLAVDTQGHVWVGVFDGTSVIRVDPSKKTLEQIIPIPATDIIAVTFGGKHYDILFIGTTRHYLSVPEAQPGAGSIFSVTGTGRRGFKPNKLYVPPSLLN